MATIVMAWEIGHNFGHVLPLLPLARLLREQGHTVVFALKDLAQVSSMVLAEGFMVLQAPTRATTPTRPPGWQPETMAQVLQLFGYAEPPVLTAHFHAWQALLKLLKADVLVASYAPTALLAARALGLRTCLLGMPFELPPPVSPSPSFRPWLNTPADRLAASDADVVRTTNQVLACTGLSIEAVHEVFTADQQVLWTFEELDPYADWRCVDGVPGARYSGAIYNPTLGPPPVWPERDGRRVFGYLRFGPQRMRQLVAALATVDASFCLVMPNLRTDEASHLQTANVAVTVHPVGLEAALAACDAVLCYGGHGTVCASLMAGLPLVFTASQMADAMLAQTVVKLGAAEFAKADDDAAIAFACGLVLREPSYRQAAVRLQRKYAPFDVLRQTRGLADLIAALA